MTEIDGWDYAEYAEVAKMEHDYQMERIDELENENEKLRKSIEKAAETIVSITGECPACRYELLSYDDCAKKCVVGIEAKCWVDYLIEAQDDALNLQTAIDADDGIRYSTDEVLDVLRRDAETSDG